MNTGKTIGDMSLDDARRVCRVGHAALCEAGYPTSDIDEKGNPTVHDNVPVDIAYRAYAMGWASIGREPPMEFAAYAERIDRNRRARGVEAL